MLMGMTGLPWETAMLRLRSEVPPMMNISARWKLQSRGAGADKKARRSFVCRRNREVELSKKEMVVGSREGSVT